MTLVWQGQYTENGAKKYIVLKQNEKTDKSLIDMYEHFDIGCGRCLACKVNKSKEWSIRCMLEASYYDHNYFVTLTYDNAPVNVSKDDLRQFIKNLRNYFSYNYNETNIRFFGCGEYGSSTFRSHYHIILFNCNIRDLELVKYDASNNSWHYDSKIIRKLWNKGIIDIGLVTKESCAYVARYVTKKAKDNYKLMNDLKITVPEFIMMSNHPGIGKTYYIDHVNDIYNNDQLFFEHGYVKPP